MDDQREAVPSDNSVCLLSTTDCQASHPAASAYPEPPRTVDLSALASSLERLSLTQEPASPCTHVVRYRGEPHSREEAGTSTERRPPQLCWEADSAWTLRMLRLLLASAQPRMLMAWCSTLGGAHSSLGEVLHTHAEQAGVMSQRQLVLASAMGDLNLVCRCRLYAAFSLLQRGQLHKAARIIREQYRYATEEAMIRDHQLITMCLSAWVRLQSLLSPPPPPAASAATAREEEEEEGEGTGRVVERSGERQELLHVQQS